jgi:hypothetical protein
MAVRETPLPSARRRNATRLRFTGKQPTGTRWRTALTLVLLACPSTSYAYRTASDLREFSEFQTGSDTLKFVWSSPSVAFRLASAAPAPLNVEEVARAVNMAMETWNTPICSALSLTLSGTTTQPARPGDSINTIQFVNDWSALGFSPNVGAVTDVQYAQVTLAESDSPRWVIAEADIYLDAENHEWEHEVADAKDPRKSILSVLTHELGHAAGLLHPCETENTRDSAGASADPNAPLCGDVAGADAALMYPEYSPTQTLLSADERAGLCFLYAQDSCETLGCTTGEVCTDQGCVPGCAEDVCAADETCFQSECVPLCAGLDCYLEQACKKTSDCPNFLRCRQAPVDESADEDESEEAPAKVCLPGDTPLGDPCDSSRDCASAACSKGGFCVAPCENDEQCAAGTSCEKTQGSVKGCLGKNAGGFGEACDEANECLGNQCVSGRTATPVCTRECSLEPDRAAFEACPAGSECGTAVTDGTERTVCLPLAEATSCTLATPTSLGAPDLARSRSSSRAFSLLGATGALALLVHFARRRKPRAHAT